MMQKGKRTYDRLVFWLSCAAYAFVFLYICAAYMPGSVLRFKYATSHIVATLYPVHWNFYTGSANEPVYRMYTVRGNKLTPVDNHPFTGKYLFGLKRTGKIIASELETIATDTPFIASAIKYTVNMPVNGDLNAYVRADTLKYNNYRSENVLYLKGQFVLTMEDCPLWQDRRKSPAMKHNITLIPINLVGK